MEKGASRVLIPLHHITRRLCPQKRTHSHLPFTKYISGIVREMWYGRWERNGDVLYMHLDGMDSVWLSLRSNLVCLPSPLGPSSFNQNPQPKKLMTLLLTRKLRLSWPRSAFREFQQTSSVVRRVYNLQLCVACDPRRNEKSVYLFVLTPKFKLAHRMLFNLVRGLFRCKYRKINYA
jgi:hypothetical protein